MVPDASKTSLGLEYFCDEDDELWSTSDRELIAQAKEELETIGLARGADIEDGCVVRVAKAYPVYDATYREHLETVRHFVDGFENLQTIGRNGLHRYNNQDHAMLTGQLSVRNLLNGERHDLWAVNTDAEYHEEMHEDVALDELAATGVLQGALARVFAKVDRFALGAAVGIVSGAMIFLATMALVLKGGEAVGPHLGLISQYFSGYSVSATGSIVGLLYGSIFGFAIGWLSAVVRNAAVLIYVVAVERRAEARVMRRFLDYL